MAQILDDADPDSLISRLLVRLLLLPIVKLSAPLPRTPSPACHAWVKAPFTAR
jgi:hypothetical protein